MKLINKITPYKEDFAQWYIDVIKNGNLIEYGPVKGTMFFKPNSFGIWERIQEEFNKIIKSNGTQNVYLPMLIPSSLFNKEKEHIEGFAPEIATITKVGEKELNEDIYIRPTSEVLFADYFKSEINSYNDLPIDLNQWANVLRWEKTTRPFLRNSEFLWQEGHTAHNSEEEAKQKANLMLKTYEKFLRDFLALPSVIGYKTDSEKFAGAIDTLTVETMMKDGKALQSATSHYLGQNFSKIYNIEFKNKENKKELIYQTSWGMSTRLIAAIIMTHGDDRGIIIPPKIAPTQVDIIEIMSDKDKNVSIVANDIKELLQKHNLSSKIDKSNKSFGFKISQSEIEGVPLRIEVGPRDLINNQVTIVRRDTLEKNTIDICDIVKHVETTLENIQKNLYSSAKKRLENNIVFANTYDEFKDLIKENKFVVVFLDSDPKLESKINEETGATSRCLPISIENKKDGKCILSGNKTSRYVLFAKSY